MDGYTRRYPVLVGYSFLEAHLFGDFCWNLVMSSLPVLLDILPRCGSVCTVLRHIAGMMSFPPSPRSLNCLELVDQPWCMVRSSFQDISPASAWSHCIQKPGDASPIAFTRQSSSAASAPKQPSQTTLMISWGFQYASGSNTASCDFHFLLHPIDLLACWTFSSFDGRSVPTALALVALNSSTSDETGNGF